MMATTRNCGKGLFVFLLVCATFAGKAETAPNRDDDETARALPVSLEDRVGSRDETDLTKNEEPQVAQVLTDPRLLSELTENEDANEARVVIDPKLLSELTKYENSQVARVVTDPAILDMLAIEVKMNENEMVHGANQHAEEVSPSEDEIEIELPSEETPGEVRNATDNSTPTSSPTSHETLNPTSHETLTTTKST